MCVIGSQQSKREETKCDSSGNLFLGLPLPGFAITISGDHDKFKRVYFQKGSGKL